MKISAFPTVKNNGYPLAIVVDFQAKNKYSHIFVTAHDGGVFDTLSFTPGFAFQLAEELILLSKWAQSPLYKWAERKTRSKLNERS